MPSLLLVAGLLLMIAGAEALVKGASRLAACVGISPLVIGLTVVACGTSTPELAVSVKAAISGQPNIALGNVVGSNIFNVLFILGLSALISPIVVSHQLVRLDVPIMIGISVLAFILAGDESLSRIDGIVLVGGLLIYTAFLIGQSRKDQGMAQEDTSEPLLPGSSNPNGWLTNVSLVVVGLSLLFLGSRWFVEGAVAIAQFLGVSDLVIGLTIVAAGTSLPEVVTSVIAAVRGKADIAVGNVVGSNIFNIMGVLGVVSVVAPSGLDVPPAVVRVDMPIMLVVAFACLPIFFTGGRISRWEGALFLGYYIAFTIYLVLAAGDHDASPHFNKIVLWYAVPLTLVTLTIIAGRQIRIRS